MRLALSGYEGVVTNALPSLERFLKFTGLVVLGLGVFFGYADSNGWLQHVDRQEFLECALEQESGLPVQHPAGRSQPVDVPTVGSIS
jgi:hypothetical protein